MPSSNARRVLELSSTVLFLPDDNSCTETPCVASNQEHVGRGKVAVPTLDTLI